MQRYEHGKIYKIVDVGLNKCYYGSTTEPLSKRMERHRRCYKQYLESGKVDTNSRILFSEYGIENCKILSTTHSHNTRSSINDVLFVSSCSSVSIGRKSVIYSTTLAWNHPQNKLIEHDILCLRPKSLKLLTFKVLCFYL